MMPDNELRKGEFIGRIVFSCINSQNSGLKIEGSLNSEYWVPHRKIFLTKFHKIPYYCSLPSCMTSHVMSHMISL